MNQLSGYIELPMGDKTLPFKFGTNCWALFCEMKGIEFSEISSSGVFGRQDDKGQLVKLPNVLILRDLFHCAHVAAMRSRGEQPMVNLEQFGDLLDETTGAVMELQRTMLTAKLMGFNYSELQEDKKKVI